jgi:hypothetical protein
VNLCASGRRVLGLLAVFAAMWIAILSVVAGLGALTDWALS